MSSRKLILYADDDPDDLELVRGSLERYSDQLEVATVSDGLEAISYLEKIAQQGKSPCLVILDINMPKLNGRETLKQIRKRDLLSNIPVILFTTSSLQNDIDFAREYDAGFISKPHNALQMDIITEQFIDHCTEDIKNQIRALR